MHSAWFRGTFLRVLKFVNIKEGRPNVWREPILQNVWIIWSPILYFNFKSFLGLISSSLIRFQWVLHDCSVLFSESWNFYKFRRGGLVSGEIEFCRKFELFRPLFYISVLKALWTQGLCHLLDSNDFCMIHQYFSQSLQILRN